MNIYFVASIYGREKHLTHYQAIVKTLRKFGHNVVEDTLQPSYDEVYGLSSKQKVDFYKQVLKWIADSDVVVAETSHPSLGVGHEISIALERGKGVIVLYTDGQAPHFLEGLESDKLLIQRYTDSSLAKTLNKSLDKLPIIPSHLTPVEFGKLLKQVRLDAGFHTLQSFSQELAVYGLEIDPSLLSHWQRGARLPKDRQVILLLLRVLIAHQGIKTPEAANTFCEAAGMGFLTDREQYSLFEN